MPDLNCAEILTAPRTDGFQEQVAVPPFAFVTAMDLQPGIVFPEARKVTFPEALTVADSDVEFRKIAVFGKLVDVIVGWVHAERYVIVTNPIPTLLPAVLS
jgi:hypothetical protein